MNIKRGIIVSNSGAIEWGAGKVVEVTAFKATIQFSDGITRKIAPSHYNILQPADPSSFVPIPDAVPVVKVRATPKIPKTPKILKEPKAPKIPKIAKAAKQAVI